MRPSVSGVLVAPHQGNSCLACGWWHVTRPLWSDPTVSLWSRHQTSPSPPLLCGHWIRTSPSPSFFPSSSLCSSSSTTGLCMTLWQGPLLSNAEGADSLFSRSRLSCTLQGEWRSVAGLWVLSIQKKIQLESVTNEKALKTAMSWPISSQNQTWAWIAL